MTTSPATAGRAERSSVPAVDEHGIRNRRRAYLLTAGFVFLVAAVLAGLSALAGWGPAGLAAALLLAGAAALAGWWTSASVVLAMSRAQPADPLEYARLHNLVEGLCIASGLPKPRVYVIDDDALNALATGRDPRHAAVAVTTGLLRALTRVELEGVVAHELSRIRSYDIVVSTLAVTFVAPVVVVADWLIRFRWWGGGRNRPGELDGRLPVLGSVGVALLGLSPVVAPVMRRVVPGRGELRADLPAVELTRYPPGLAAALEKLRDGQTVVHSGSRATAQLWIQTPIALTPEQGELCRINRRFDIHPPIEERIAALYEL
ncbi:MAG: M48 family metalloprotease [Actinobacteria bacterium]|nr:M48 family metalloprotease [Actinomycetota bacterium]